LGRFRFQGGHLLAKSEGFERHIGAAAKEDAGGGEQCEHE